MPYQTPDVFDVWRCEPLHVEVILAELPPRHVFPCHQIDGGINDRDDVGDPLADVMPPPQLTQHVIKGVDSLVDGRSHQLDVAPQVHTSPIPFY